jgi:hypothetical protein
MVTIPVGGLFAGRDRGYDARADGRGGLPAVV